MRVVRSVLSAAAAAAALCITLPAAGPSVAQKRPADETRTEITVATYNVCKVNCSSRHPWKRRRMAVKRTVQAARPAVLAVQEAPTLRWRSTTQWADLTKSAGTRRVPPDQQPGRCTQGCTRGAHLYFDPQRIRVFEVRKPSDSGTACAVPQVPRRPGSPRRRRARTSRLVRARLPGTPGVHALHRHVDGDAVPAGTQWATVGRVQDRNVSWPYLQDLASGGVFMALSMHLPNEKTTQGEQLRRQVSARVASRIDAQNVELGLGAIPIVAMGDLNSFQKRQPQGAQTVFYDFGFVDAFQAPLRINARFPTVNFTLRPASGRVPAKPFKYARLASRIDYVLGKNGVRPLTHEVFLKLRNGRFDKRFRGSDHNLVRATLSVPVVLR